MSRLNIANKGDCRLSYSSAKLIKNCTMKYWHYKVNQTPVDSDYEKNREPLAVGSAFHYVLEMNKHTNENVAALVKEAVLKEDIPHKQGLVHAMVLKYLKLHYATGLKCLMVELEITDEQFLGFIDAIMVDEDGKWWIVDLKTAAYFKDLTANKLHNDTQLNLYANYARDIAPHIKMDINDFGGVRYRATTKSSIKRSGSETYPEYVKRIYQRIESFDAVIEAKDLRPQHFMNLHMKSYDMSLRLRSGELEPECNYDFCDSFNGPCQYWSQCHGTNFTEGRPKVKILRV